MSAAHDITALLQVLNNDHVTPQQKALAKEILTVKLEEIKITEHPLSALYKKVLKQQKSSTENDGTCENNNYSGTSRDQHGQQL